MKRKLTKNMVKNMSNKPILTPDEASKASNNLTEAEKDEVQALVLRELAIVSRSRIALLESVLGRKVSIETNLPMSESDTRILSLSLK